MTYTVTINIAGAGTPTTTGPSFAGHMWYSLDNGSGTAVSYGFAPVDGATGIDRAFGDGDVHTNDSSTYTADPAHPITTVTLELTQAQYDAMKTFGDTAGALPDWQTYNGLWNSCVDFVWAALGTIGLNPTGTRYNKKTVTVITDSGQQWNVAPSFLRKTDAAFTTTAISTSILNLTKR